MTIVPIKELRDTARIEQLCKERAEPVHVTKNGYASLVVMTEEVFDLYVEEQCRLAVARSRQEAELEEVVADVHESRRQYEAGEGVEATEAVRELRGQCGL